MSDQLEENGIVVHGPDGNIHYAFYADGRTFHLRGDEKKRTMRDILALISADQKMGTRRCTSCGCDCTKDEVGGYPLFAGINCKACWEKHLEKAKTERRCTLCGQPMSFCSC